MSIASRGLAIYPYFTLAKESLSYPPKSYTVPVLGAGFRLVTPAGLAKGLEEGNTLKLQFLEVFRPDLLSAVRQLDVALHGKSTLYGFLTPPGTRGLSVHRDASSVVVYQVSGRKSWHVWRPDDASEVPSKAGLVPTPSGEEITFTLEPGDAMFLPFGWPHAAEAIDDEASFHLTWTIDHLSPEGFLSFTSRVPTLESMEPISALIAARSAYGYGDTHA